ncbi:AbrB/MazE/SpoVT family DNA-binding domain-containing protein [Altererythrobacter soli]|uniref:AbrB/MazE/SpoVT family DNA-binding domain-containing protein n=1 Tax=Croceibacterium soli TaxID=1739690 RepID=A0A6I4UYC6_9SPHN|nr:AbrB/MazE/SpoVT family DNA-binding domain-containing protein [Croceibacterium soli]MXP42317.1 AbrB/MazE/SpoVT family DNA-binding domain-containing protein [Croceibacterium soli]
MNHPVDIKKLKLVKIGNSTGVILPKEVLDRLNLSAGDQLTYTQTPDGIALSSRGDDFDSQMAAARDVMKRYRNALRELAK